MALLKGQSILVAVQAVATQACAQYLHDPDYLEWLIETRWTTTERLAHQQEMARMTEMWEEVGWRLSALHTTLENMVEKVADIADVERQRARTQEVLHDMAKQLEQWAHLVRDAKRWLRENGSQRG